MAHEDGVTPMRVVGACHGFAVRSRLPLTYVRDAGGAMTPVEVAQESVSTPPLHGPLIGWEPRDGNPLRARVHPWANGYEVWVDGIGTYRVDAANTRLTVPPTPHEVRREEHLWAMPAVLLFSALGRLPLHAAAVEIPTGALVLAAPGRYGKTTLATAFVRSGFRLLAEDLVCVDVDAGPAILPGPAMLRIRRDVADRVGPVPGTVEVLRTPERVHLGLDATARGTGAPVPLRAIVMLSFDNELGHDRAVLQPMRPAAAVPNLWTVSFNLPSDHDRTRCFDVVTRLATATDLWGMTRRLRYTSLPAMVEQLVEHFS